MPQIWLSILLLLTAYFTHFVRKYVASYMQENNNLGLLENFVFDQLIVLWLMFYLISLIIFLTLTITFLQNLLQML